MVGLGSRAHFGVVFRFTALVTFGKQPETFPVSD